MNLCGFAHELFPTGSLFAYSGLLFLFLVLLDDLFNILQHCTKTRPFRIILVKPYWFFLSQVRNTLLLKLSILLLMRVTRMKSPTRRGSFRVQVCRSRRRSQCHYRLIARWVFFTSMIRWHTSLELGRVRFSSGYDLESILFWPCSHNKIRMPWVGFIG